MEGTITALITPFHKGEIDEEAFIKHLHFQKESGISGFLLLGTVGEAMTLSLREKERLISLAVKEMKGKLPLIVGTGHNCTRTTLEFSKRAQDLGADIAMVVTPYYNKPTQEGVYRHFQALSDSLSIPIMAYNNHGRSVVNIETPTLTRIANLPGVVGIKEASGNLYQVGEVLEALPQFKVFSGDDALALPMIALGARGVVSTVSNLIPKEMSALINFALEGNFEKARILQRALTPLFKAAFIEVNPVPIKTALHFVKQISAECRLPLCEMSPENTEILKNTLKQIHLL